jgi:hypothetical protein
MLPTNKISLAKQPKEPCQVENQKELGQVESQKEPCDIPNIKVFKHEDEKPADKSESSESEDSDTDELVICNRVNYTPEGQHVIYITRSGAFIDDYDKIETLNVRRMENYFTCCTK